MIKVIVADDERLIRDALYTMLGVEKDIEVIGVAADGLEAVALAQRAQPTVAVLDLQMPRLDGISAAAEIARLRPPVATVILTSHTSPGRLRAAIDAGVLGYLPKDTPVSTLAQAIRKAAQGTRYIDPDLATELIAVGDNPLGRREINVLRLSLNGDPVEQIAASAGISGSSARNYLSSAMRKLGAPNRHAAAQLALARGWL
ncbi:MAG: response regulator transcription factor [Promicromonosporaceae bacterium]|nr:response regulator transcription factor [Promicromonosporaceae bacterium]